MPQRVRMALGFAGPLAVLGVLIYLLVHHGSQIGHAAGQLSAVGLVVVTALGVLTLMARSEAAVACLTAMGTRPRRRDIYAASSLTFVVGTINHYVASPLRAALLKRLAPEQAPTIPQMMLVDASTYLIEGLLAAGLVIASASTLKLAWWVAPLTLLGALGALVVALLARQRWQRHPIFRGLEILSHSRQRLIVVGLMIGLFACQIARTLIVLRATGLHASLLQAAATFVAGGVLSALLAGPSAATVGAPLIIFGHSSISEAAAAGLILSITALVAAACFAVPGAAVYLWRVRQLKLTQV